MKTLLNEADLTEIKRRIEALQPEDMRLWGKMNCGEMLCHCTDQLRLAINQRPAAVLGGSAKGFILKWLVLLGMPAPKGKIETFRELKQGAGGTPPTTFTADKQALIGLVTNFAQLYPAGKVVVHPAFGAMNKNQWGRLTYIHLDHHLQQFGR